MITWCVAHTQPNKERVALQNLRNQGFEVYLPLFKKLRKHARKVEEVLYPLFPRYIFVGFDNAKARWRSINGTKGVTYLIMKDEINPSTLPSRIIEDLKSQELSSNILPISSLVSFEKGEKVRIAEGAFKNTEGVFEGFDDKQRVEILINFLGRESKVSLPIYAVESAI